MDEPKPTLALADSLTASQIPGRVVIKASGSKPTPGHEVRFEESPLAVFPPEYLLVIIPPAGNVTQVITPFEVDTFFAATEPVATVTVTDATGRKAVIVDPAHD